MQFPKPETLLFKVASTQCLSHKIRKIELSIVNPSEFVFLPGQFINIEVSPGTFRAYSLASDSKNKKNIAKNIAKNH